MAKTNEIHNEIRYDIVPDVFHVTFEQQKKFNAGEGKWELLPLYSTPAWVKYHERMIVLEGQATTNDIETALELVDVPGVTVTPDPRPYRQEQYAAELKIAVEASPTRAWEFYKYVQEANAWRKEHGLPALLLEAPVAYRPTSALVQPIAQIG